MANSSPAADSPTQPVLRVLLDTNVVLDWVLNRPEAVQAQALWQARDAKTLLAYFSASAVTDVFYIAENQQGRAKATAGIDQVLKALRIVPVDLSVLLRARSLPSGDFEDNVVMACAEAEHLDFIITRNIKDFNTSPVMAIEPFDISKHLPTL
jgi:predicted nucleic acid-binding protein